MERNDFVNTPIHIETEGEKKRERGGARLKKENEPNLT